MAINPASQNIIISQIPDAEDLVDDKKKATATWVRWLSQLQIFINNFFQIFMIVDSTGNVPRTVFAPPQMSQADRDALQQLTNGVIIFNTTSGKINYYQLGSWAELP